MIEVEIGFVGPVRRPDGLATRSVIRLPEGAATVDGLLFAVGYEEAERRHLRVLVSGRPTGRGQALRDGDVVTIYLAVGGG